MVKALITAEALRWCTGLSIDTWGCHLLKVYGIYGTGRVPEPMGNCWFMLVLYYLIKENPWNSNPPTWSIAWLSTQKCRCRNRSGHNMYISNKCWKQKDIFSGFQMQTIILSFLSHESMWWFDYTSITVQYSYSELRSAWWCLCDLLHTLTWNPVWSQYLSPTSFVTAMRQWIWGMMNGR